MTPEPNAKPRYDWSKAPEWAMWAATDEADGSWWYSHRPTTELHGQLGWRWYPASSDHVPMPVRINEEIQLCCDWHKSLEQRPSAAEPNATGVDPEQPPMMSCTCHGNRGVTRSDCPIHGLPKTFIMPTQPVDPPLRPRVGGYYELRNGRPVGPLVANKTGYLEDTHPFAFNYGVDDWKRWRSNGLYCRVFLGNSITNEDIASELPAPETQEKPIRKHIVESAGYWFNAAWKSQREGSMADALMAMENAYNHVDNALYAANQNEALLAQVKELSFQIRRHRGHLLIAQGWLFLDNPAKALELVNQWLDETPHSPEVETV